MRANKKQTSVIDKKAKQYASRHRFDGDQIELYIECHEAKIRAFKAGAKWKEKQIIEWLRNNAGAYMDWEAMKYGQDVTFDTESLIEDLKKETK